MNPSFVDSHLHLQDDRFGMNAACIIETAAKAGVAMLLCNAAQESDWEAILNLHRPHDAVIPFFGVHPWYIDKAADGWDTRLKKQLESCNGSGVGESGLDKTCASDFSRQINAFEKHLEIALHLVRPIAVHCVRSWGTLIEILETRAKHTQLPATMIHSFNGSEETMKRLTRIGCFLSFSLQVTSSHNKKLLQTMNRTPLDRLLLETDAPARLSPSALSHTGSLPPFSEPAMIPEFYRWAALQRNSDPLHFKTQIWHNAQIYTNRTARW